VRTPPTAQNLLTIIFSIGCGSYGQFLCYLTKINSLASLRYYFDKAKLTNFGESDPEGYVKGVFKTLFTNKGVDIYNSNPTLFNQYNRPNGQRIQNSTYFEELVNSSTFSVQHPIFNFIQAK